MTKIIIFLLAMLPFFSKAQIEPDTIYVKKVFVNGRSIKVRAGYIIKLDSINYMVNKKHVELVEYKPTNKKNYRPKNNNAQ